jgi:hypothetical protein
MNIKKILPLSAIFLLTVFLTVSGFKEEKDALHKRNFNVNIVEIKDKIPQKKTIADEISFKDGKLYSGFLNDKFSYKWLKYRINRDSLYMDSTDTEIRLLEVEATTTDESNNTLLMNIKVEDWDIDGTIKITKNDKLKKYFEFTGREKGGKPKKEKKKKNEDKPAVEVKPGEPKPGEEEKK